MSLQGKDDQDSLGDTLRNTTLDSNDDVSGTGTSSRPEPKEGGEGARHPQSTVVSTQGLVQSNDTSSNHADSTTSSNTNTPTISFAEGGIETEEDVTIKPGLTRRKSSLSTAGSRLRRAASMEKHVTIADTAAEGSAATGEAQESSAGHGEQETSSKDTSKEDEDDQATKEELAKILMQFDPLADTQASKDKVSTETTVMRDLLTGADTIDSLQPEAATTLSPNLSVSGSSSPRTPQQLNSPRTSHDVQVAMTEKATGGSSKSGSSKRKGEGRSKSEGGTAAFLKSKASGSASMKNSSSGSEVASKPKDIPFDFHKFLEQMRHRSAIPITRYFQSFLKEFDRKPWTVNEQIKIIHDFLEFITGKMAMCDLWKNATDQEFENVKEGMEKLVMNRLFAYTFSPSTTDDAERDEVLSQKIRIFRWVKEEHLDIPSSPYNEAYLNNAQAELKKINSYKAPRDKVICILNCCKFIFTLIRRSEGNSKGADTFLPILIYVVLRSNPPHLVSNVQYISLFRNPEKLQAEAGYYLASLMGAISFIENMEASSLSISPEEFDRHIETTMAELSKEKAEAIAAAEAAKASSSSSSSAGAGEDASRHRKQESKLATLLAGTAATRNASRQRQTPINEKQFMAAEAAAAEAREREKLAVPAGGSLRQSPAASLMERGAHFATKTIQRPLDLIERMFQDGGDEEEMAKPYPPRSGAVGQTSQQRPNASGGDDGSFTEFVYVPAGHQVQQPVPQQVGGLFSQQQQQQQQGYPGSVALQSQTRQSQEFPRPQQQQQQQSQQSMEEYRQALNMLTDMFPTCERQVCDVILQANDGRLSPSIDALLEISSGNDERGGTQEPERGQDGSPGLTLSGEARMQDAAVEEEVEVEEEEEVVVERQQQQVDADAVEGERNKGE
ncbi:hypothetical protein BGZ99_001167 [Dissophora globulifera]|uniref:Uncharacterized protein n=1 Tax=Dissophora globulifera TaxID=979702 RepID=A0A9P6R358_9FUNG|nr:hypothetical protein BGZ99_001167 [Dissophora globulifera]